MSNVVLNVLPRTPLPAPSPLVNEAVLRILASLDARIELLRRAPDLDQFRMRLYRLNQEVARHRECVECIGLLLRDTEHCVLDATKEDQ